MRKLRGLRFLPGGTDKYVDTLMKCLEFVKDESPDKERLRQWFYEGFPRVKGERAVDGYIRVAKDQFGLIKQEGGRFVLTENGKEFLETRNPRLLFQILGERIDGVHDILQLLSVKPCSLLEVDSALRTRFGWKTHFQTFYRLGWLQSLGCVTKIGQTCSLTEDGRAAFSVPELGVKAELIKPPEEEMFEVKEAPMILSRNEIRDTIYEIGKFDRIGGCPKSSEMSEKSSGVCQMAL